MPVRIPGSLKMIYLGLRVPREHKSGPISLPDCCRRVLGCHPLPGCMEEELGGM